MPKIPRELAAAADFHTHLGPFLVVGLRMGRVVTRELGGEPFSIKILAQTGRVPPYSCALDGIQIATPCTIGNGDLEISDRRTMTISATGTGKTVTVKLNDDVSDSIEAECTTENQESYACAIWEMPEEQLLTIEVMSTEEATASVRA